VVIDATRTRAHNVVSFLYQEKSAGTTPPLLVADFALPS
jgi:hypothetical protein